MTGLELVVLGLATYRLTRLIYKDDITEPVRSKLWWYLRSPVAKTARERHSKTLPAAEWLFRLIGCPYCVGIWCAGGLILLLAVPYVNFFVYLLAVAGAASLVQEVLDTRDNLVE
jgi:hypothetical protein